MSTAQRVEWFERDPGGTTMYVAPKPAPDRYSRLIELCRKVIAAHDSDDGGPTVAGHFLGELRRELPPRPMPLPPPDDPYEVGYRDGGSNAHADWEFALGEVLPDGVELSPTSVADYVERLLPPDSDHEPPLWQITVRVPLSLPVEMRDELFAAVARAVHDWEPDDRDGWDADVTGAPAVGSDQCPKLDEP